MKSTLSGFIFSSISILALYQIKTSLKLDYYDNSKTSHDDLISEIIDERNKPSYSINQKNKVFNKKINENEKRIAFSACLMVKDENHNLPEWIAYHYTMTSLRHLVICLDPNSKTKPQTVLQKWGRRMKIEIWHNTSYFDPNTNFNAKMLERDYETDQKKSLTLHRARQRDCYKHCMMHLKKEGRTWTMLIDVDEYLTFNPVAADDTDLLYTKDYNNDTNDDDHNNKELYRFNPHAELNRSDVLRDMAYTLNSVQQKYLKAKRAKRRAKKGNNQAKEIKKRRNLSASASESTTSKKSSLPDNKKLTDNEKQLMKMRTRVPNTITSVLTYIKNEIQGTNNPYQNSACIVLPRLQFGSTEETSPSKLYKDIPSPLRSIVHNLTTVRFFHHYKKGSMKNRAGKCIVDVSRMQIFNVVNPHRINTECGSQHTAFAEHYTSVLRVNHYSGTKDIYFAQGGVRRDDKNFDRKSNASHAVCYEMQGWLERFVKLVGGVDRAKILLDGAGRIAT